jgi:glutathione S-transferase
MKLVGLYISPFVRRVAIALNVLGMPFEHLPVSVVDGRDVIGRYNGLVRVPSLILDDGDILVDSHQILAELDRLSAPASLCVSDAASLRSYGQMIAFLTGALEKNVAAFYEQLRRPAHLVWPEWAQQCIDQAIGGIAAAEALAPPSVQQDGFLFEGRLTHADIAAVLAFEAISQRLTPVVAAQRFPRLAALSERLSGTPAFASTRPPPTP